MYFKLDYPLPPDHQKKNFTLRCFHGTQNKGPMKMTKEREKERKKEYVFWRLLNLTESR